MDGEPSGKTIPPAPHNIEVDFFSERSRKTTKLVNNNDPGNFVKGRNSWYSFSFLEPVFLTELSIDSDGYSSWDKFQIVVEHIDGTEHDEKLSVSNNKVSLRLGKLSKGFRFKPDQKLFSNPNILKVTVTGLNLAEFNEYEWAIRDHDKREKNIAKKETTTAELDERLADLKVELSTVNDSIGKARSEHEALQANNSNLKAQVSELNKKQKDTLSALELQQSELREIKTEISKKERELNDITREVRLFPSEIVGFVKEGNRNIKSYSLIGLPFAIMLGIILFSMFSSAVDLTQLWRLEENLDIWVILLTRLPFLLLALAIIETCSYVIARLVFEVMRINRQRLELSKLSIIAKDLSTAAANGLEMSEEERFTEETKLRMNLLREHMANYPEQDFVYKGSAIMTAIIGVADKISNKKA